MGSLNGIVINSLLIKECTVFSDVSGLGVCTESDRFQNAPLSHLCIFVRVFLKGSIFTVEQCERKTKQRSFALLSSENGAV